MPYGQMGLTPIPEDVSDDRALFVGDILASGYFGAELCAIQPGDTVAVIGAGPVSLCAMQCARLMGAGRVVAVDLRAERLALARRLGLSDETAPPERAREVVAGLSEGRGADGVIEAAGGAGSFELAWQVARANAVVALVAMYEGDQVLPLPRMYGKNLIFKTGGVDAVHSARLLSLIAAGRLNTDFLITHRGSLARIEQGYRTFSDPAARLLEMGGHAIKAGTARNEMFRAVMFEHQNCPSSRTGKGRRALPSGQPDDVGATSGRPATCSSVRLPSARWVSAPTDRAMSGSCWLGCTPS